MPRFLYGSVTVNTIEINADDREAAEKLIVDHEYEGADKKKTTYRLHWTEQPESDIAKERDGVLQEFLNLISKHIPRPDVVPPVIITLDDHIKNAYPRKIGP